MPAANRVVTTAQSPGVGRTVGYVCLLLVALAVGDVIAAVVVPAEYGTNPRILVSVLVAWPPMLLLIHRGMERAAAEPPFLLRTPRIGVAIGGGLAGLGLSLLLLVLVTYLPAPPPSAERFFEALSDSSPIPLWIAMLLVAPVMEELFYRGWMLPIWERRVGRWAAILGTAFLFALMHILWWRILMTFPLGVLFGWIASRTRNVVPAMAGHAGANAAPMVTDGLLAIAGHSASDVEALKAMPSWTGVLAFAVLLLGLRLVGRARELR